MGYNGEDGSKILPLTILNRFVVSDIEKASKVERSDS